MRIHEGDGEADHDFAAFEASKPLKQYDLDEYCLCEVDGHVTTVRDESSFAINVFQSMDMLPGQGAGTDPLGLLKNRSSMAIPPALLDDNSYDQYAPETFTDTRPFPGDAMDAMETATIRFPNGATVDVPFEADTTLSALLPLIAKLFPLTKLRLYTDEYVFSLSQPDFKRLQYVSPKIDSKTKVASVGTTYFELTKKTYADSMKVVKKALPDGQTAPAVRPTEVEFHFSEATANAYQEWNTVKKNRFGRRQERIFGVDGKRVYNGKRGQLKGGANQKVSPMFCAVWQESGGVLSLRACSSAWGVQAASYRGAQDVWALFVSDARVVFCTVPACHLPFAAFLPSLISSCLF